MEEVINTVHSCLSWIVLDFLKSQVINNQVKDGIWHIVSIETNYFKMIMFRYCQQITAVLSFLRSYKSIVTIASNYFF